MGSGTLLHSEEAGKVLDWVSSRSCSKSLEPIRQEAFGLTFSKGRWLVPLFTISGVHIYHTCDPLLLLKVDGMIFPPAWLHSRVDLLEARTKSASVFDVAAPPRRGLGPPGQGEGQRIALSGTPSYLQL